MFLHWAVLAPLLLLLPHAANGEESTGTKLEDPGEGTVPCSEEPIVEKCPGGTCTIYCFVLWYCSSEYDIPQNEHSLFLSAISFLKVEDNGRIDSRYANIHTAKWQREVVGNRRGNKYLMSIPHEKNVADKKMAEITDTIIYIGSDCSSAYDPITYRYDPTYLQLKDTASKPKNLYKDTSFSVCSNKGNGEGINLFTYAHTSKDPNSWISNPGIYRLNRATGEITELNYDPTFSEYLT